MRRGGYLSDMRAVDAELPTVLVATPEAFDALLRQRPELYRNLAACVFDEFHLIEQQERGLRYEGLIGRLLSGAAGQGWPKIVALSAVIKDIANVRHWLKIEDGDIAQLPWRPASRRLAIVNASLRARNIQYFCPDEKLPGTGGTEEVAWYGQISLPNLVETMPLPRYRARLRQQISENVAQVAIDQWQRLQQPILVLANSKSGTRVVARAIARQLPELGETKSTRLAERIRSRFPYLYTLQECLRHGIAYHNAALPNWVRSQLEEIIGEKELKIVTATTTLAEGVDLPFRVVILADWHMWLFGRQQPIPTLLFRNIAGRCGRAWEFVEGDTIIIDNPDEKYTSYPSRHQEYVRLYVNPQPYPLRSSIERALEPGSQESLSSTVAVLEPQITAHIDACAKSEDIESEFTRSLYASLQTNAAEFIYNQMVQFTKDMVADPNYPVMRRQSPLELTDFGRIVLRTGLSPRSGIALADFIRN